MNSERIRVAVVFGGRSGEHAVSCISAGSVLGHLDPELFEVTAVGITPDGAWVRVDPQVVLQKRDRELPSVHGGAAVVLPGDPTSASLVPLDGVGGSLEVDVVFPLLHGPFGEDGTLQGLLELADVRYVGSGVLASAVGMDKHYMKVVLAGHGLAVGPYVVIRDREWQRDPSAAMAAVASLGWPVFVKPARAGSSMGISKVSSADGLRDAVEAARTHDPKVVVEAAVTGRELECAVLQSRDGSAPRTSEVGEVEVVRGHEFYDFAAKYLAEADVRLSCPADVPDEVADEVRRVAAVAFDAVGCEGLARVDCFYTSEGTVLVNEINTMPGFTPLSMYPRMWARSGIGYPQLIDELVELALARRTGLR